MAGERKTKRSCPFCQHEDRDTLEQNIIDAIGDVRTLDKDMGWRANTSDRHMNNHIGDYHTDSNHSCLLCTDDNRSMYEVSYFEDNMSSEDISQELGC